MPGTPQPLRGDETFHAGPEGADWTVLEFWRWAASDLLSNTTRGMLAEFIVARALGSPLGVRTEWDNYDVRSPQGVTVEVKTSAYLQTWFQPRPSKIKYGIAPARRWNLEDGTYALEPTRQAQVYVFCLLSETSRERVDPLNLEQWRFHVLPARVLDERCPTQRTLSLATLLRLNPKVTDWRGLAEAVHACAEPRPVP